jgi:hypothetical protein
MFFVNSFQFPTDIKRYYSIYPFTILLRLVVVRCCKWVPVFGQVSADIMDVCMYVCVYIYIYMATSISLH